MIPRRDLEEGTMREGITKIRWRLLVGVISLVLAVTVTLPAAASRVDLAQRVAEIWPNALSPLTDGSDLMGEIWPNAAVLGDGVGSPDSEDAQN